MSLVLRELDHGVLVLTLNKPERNNAWSPDMEAEYFAALLDGAADPEVRVVVVTGAGKSFCPGMDIQILVESSASGAGITDNTRWPMTLARLVPKPVIAAVNGACAGVGFVQACSADIRFAAKGAKLSTSFARRGLPAENSLSWILPRLIGTGPAMDLLISGRTILAEEAHELGLVNHLCEPASVVDDAVAYARDLSATCSPKAMAAIKQQVWTDWDRSAEESRRKSLALMEALRPELQEGSASYAEKRPPRFEGVSIGFTEERAMRLTEQI